MAHLGQSIGITTVKEEEIVLTGSDGQTFKIKMADLTEAIREVMPVSTNNQKGLASQYTPIYYPCYKKVFSLNDLVNNGYYYIDDDLVREGAPSGFSNYCIIVFNAGFPVQMLYDYKYRILFRIKWATWSRWMKVNFTDM